jgi:DNA-binding HxlR family transcriptional regulator
VDEPDRDDALSCSIARTLEIVGDRWSILILRDAFRGIRRFDHFHRDLGVARNLLADRLAKLVEHGVFEKVPYQERPVRFEYRLTPKGVDLSPSLVALMRWGDRWLAGEAGAPVVLVHDACGRALDQEFICWRCDVTVTPGHIRSRHARPDDPAPPTR